MLNLYYRIKKSLLYDHNNWKEHGDTEENFIKKCMTYCKNCDKEIKKDEWREHIRSEKQLKKGRKKHCNLCQIGYLTFGNSFNLNKSGFKHLKSDVHKKN